MTDSFPGRGRNSLLLAALWFGLLTGMGEVTLLMIRRYVLHRFIFIGKDAIWMAPVADATYLCAAGLIVWLVSRLLPRKDFRRLGIGVFVGLSAFTLLLMYGPLHRLAAAVIAIGIGVQAARMLGTRLGSFERLVRRTVPVLVALVVCTGLGLHAYQWWRERRAAAVRPAAQSGAPNILLIVLDTVRSFDLDLYGYARATTPHLDQWAKKGVRFVRALATAPWTLPSHASMFTGHYPHDLSADWETPLDAEYPTLAEVLEAHGYRTGGFVGNIAYCSYETGLARGFSHYDDYVINPTNILLSSSLAKLSRRTKNLRYSSIRKTAATVSREFLGWLDRTDDRHPFFAFLNYVDAHGPYDPPAPFDSLFGNSPSRAQLRRVVRTTPASKWDPAEIQAARDAYDGAIAYLDSMLDSLFLDLDRRGLADNTLIIVVGDHGEEFGEHGVFYHGNSLYRASIQVPLVLALPGRQPAGLVVDRPVSLHDIPATIMAIALPGVPSPFPGRALTRFWSGGDAGTSRPDTLLQEVNHAVGLPKNVPVSLGPMRAVVLDGFRLIRRGDGEEELFDFQNDTGEQHDLAGDPAYAAKDAELDSALVATLGETAPPESAAGTR